MESKIISYLIGISHEKQIIIHYWLSLNKKNLHHAFQIYN